MTGPHPTGPVTAAAVAAAVTTQPCTWTSEADLQDQLAERLQALGPVRREAALTARDRIDFLLGDIGVEVKVNGAVLAVFGQLQRYARTGRVAALVLATTCVRHTELPDRIAEIPVHVAYLPPHLA